MKAYLLIFGLLLAANYQAIMGGHVGWVAVLLGHALVALVVWAVWWALSAVVRTAWGKRNV